MSPDSEAPDIDDIEATDEGFEDAPQEDTPGHTIGSLMESDPLGMTGAQEPKHQEVTGHFSVIVVIYGHSELSFFKRTTLFDYFFPDSVGPDNIAGFRHVDALCEYLLKLDGVKGLSLTDSQVSEVIRLWLNLNDYDKKKIIYVKRHQERLVQGRFHCSKKKKNVFLV